MAISWSVIKLVHGKPRHSQSQGSVERANQDVRDSLVAWMTDNNCNNWAKALRIIQSTKNRSYHTGIKRTPYEALFGTPLKNGLSDTCLDKSIVNEIRTEEQLQEQLTLIEKSLAGEEICHSKNATERNNEDNDKTESRTSEDSGNRIDEIDNQASPTSVNSEMVKCDICSDMYARGDLCIECDESFHPKCGPNLELPLCKLCANKRAIDCERKGCKTGLEKQAEKMLQQSHKKFSPADVGDNVLVNIPDVDRGRLAPRNIVAVIMEKTTEDLYVLGTKNGKLKRLFSRNEFQLSPSKFLSLDQVPSASTVNVRQDAMMSSGSRQGFVSCNCQKWCKTKACSCVKKEVKCNSKCHIGQMCKNK